MISVIDRLWRHTEIVGDCWVWHGSGTTEGYGLITVDHHRRLVHRIAYEECVGPIPDGLQLDHVKDRGCNFKTCWNPDHLEPVTCRENLARSGTAWAVKERTGFCRRGHQQTLDTIKIYGGKKHCQLCDIERNRERRVRC